MWPRKILRLRKIAFPSRTVQEGVFTAFSALVLLDQRGLAKIYPVVAEAVGMCEIAAAISKGGGKRGKRFHRFPMLSTDRQFHGQRGFQPRPRRQYT